MSLRYLILGSVFAGGVVLNAITNHRLEVPAPPPAAPVKAAAEKAPAKKSPANYHTEAVRAFGETPGFGFGRMKVTRREVEDTFVQWSPGELDDDAPAIEVPDLAKVHRESGDVLVASKFPRLNVLPFSVASRHPDGAKHNWRLQSINLIALVDHEQPLVYITARLPHQDEPHAVGKKADKSSYTRSLDFLEIAALTKLKGGDEIFIRTKDHTLRMIGALRATKQCLECHDGKEGDLFGAFSYNLTNLAR